MANPNLRIADVEWMGANRFQGGSPESPLITLDSSSKAGPSPMVTLLIAAAACSGADVVSILEKMRVVLARFRMRVSGIRADDHPRRYRSLHFEFTLAGEGLDETKARRAIDLSIGKYCSVVQSLNPDIPVTYDLVLES